MLSEQTIASIAQTIVDHYHPERIILFGSHARGEAGSESDLDLCVIMNSSLRPMQRMVEVRSLFPRPQWPMDILVYTPQEFEERCQLGGAFERTIAREGKVLYDARAASRV
jgi:predicted nucleotidyltransferase